MALKTVAVTGANGFLGRHLCAYLEGQGRRVIRIVRSKAEPKVDCRVVPDLTVSSELTTALNEADAVVHLAARAHVLRERSTNPEAAFRAVNVDGTKSVCVSAHRAGVGRIVLVSSIGVNGARTDTQPFNERSAVRPVGPYAISKWESEQLMDAKASELGFEAVVVRPPLIYGPGVKGNFQRLLTLANCGVPLPLGSITNKRSLVGVQNLSALLALCIDSPLAAGQTYLAADPQARSTPELLRALYSALGRRDLLFSVPAAFLRKATQLLGLGNEFDKICGSLEIASDKARRELGWISRVGFEEGIAQTAQWYLENLRARQ